MSPQLPNVQFDSSLHAPRLQAWTIDRLETHGNWPSKVSQTFAGAFAILFVVLECSLILAGVIGLPLWALIVIAPMAITASGRLNVSFGIWCQACLKPGRPLSFFLGTIQAFQACMRDMVSSALPNPAIAPTIVAGIASITTTFIRKKLTAAGPSWTSNVMSRLVISFDYTVCHASHQFFVHFYMGFEHWRKRQRVVAAQHRDLHEVGLDVYWSMARAYLKHFLMIDRYRSMMSDEDIQALIGKHDWHVRMRWISKLRPIDSDPEHLAHDLDLMEAANVPPWWSPTNDLPTIGELALRLHCWHRAKGQDDDMLCSRLAGIMSRIESHQIESELAAPQVCSSAIARRL